MISGRYRNGRVDLSSSKRSIQLKNHSYQYDSIKTSSNDVGNGNDCDEILIYEYCVGSIRNNLFAISSVSLMPNFVNKYIMEKQYGIYHYLSERDRLESIRLLMEQLINIKMINRSNFQTNSALISPKWCSSIYLIQFIKYNNDNSKEISEQYLMKETRYLIPFQKQFSNSIKQLFHQINISLPYLPHWTMVKIIQYFMSNNILNDIASQLTQQTSSIQSQTKAS